MASLSVEQSAVLIGGLLLAVALFLNSTSVDKIPSVGVGSGPFASQVASRRSAKSVQDWVVEGYRKYNVFKIRVFQSWRVVVSGPGLIDELRKAPKDVLSFEEATAETIEADYTLGHDWRDGSHITVSLVKGRLTRSLPALFPSVMEEMAAAFKDELASQLNGNEWTTVHIMRPLMRVVCRTSNRIFVGLPLCRDPEYIDLNVQYTIDVAKSANTIKRWPWFLKPIIGRYLTPLRATYARAERVMRPFVEERKRALAEHGKDWEEKPDDFLQWIIDTGEPRFTETDALMTRILRLNFAAIHTTALSFTFALYHLAAEPEKYLEPIRQEVIEVLSRHGWTKAATERMRRIDSLLREAQRFHGLGALSMSRKALQDFSFSDGTQIKKGQLLAVASRGTHRDAAIYPKPDEFDGFRFFDENEGEADELSLPNRLVSTSFEFLTFGTGRHACPGRFWAANEMKAMMAYMVLNFDMRMKEGVAPEEQWSGESITPDVRALMVLKKREAPEY